LRKLVPLKRFLEDFEEGGDDADTLFIDPEDVVEIEEEDDEEE